MILDLQKASMWKRISAALFDLILLGIAAVFFAWLLAGALGIDQHYEVLDERYTHYESLYGVSRSLTHDQLSKMTEAEIAQVQAASDAIASDPAAVHAYNMVIQLIITISSLSIFLAFLMLEFFIPVLLHNGQTLGKKIFGVALMRTEGVSVNPVCMFIRAILGRYVAETMIPLIIIVMIFMGTMGIMGTLVVLALLIGEIVLMITTRENALIHDKMADTVCVDLASQMIFPTRESLLEYKTRKHAEEAARAEY